MVLTSICSFLVILSATPQALAQQNGFLSSANSSQTGVSFSGDVDASGAEPAFSEVVHDEEDSMAPEDEEEDGSSDVLGFGYHDESPVVSGDVQSIADTAETQADSTEPASEVLEDFDHDEAEVEPSDDIDRLEFTSFAQADKAAGTGNHAFVQYVDLPGTEIPEASREAQGAFIQSQGRKYIGVSDEDVRDAMEEANIVEHDNDETRMAEDENGNEAQSDEENDEADSTANDESETEVPELADHPAEGSDVALYGSNSEDPLPVDTAGSEAGSDMALYANGNGGAMDSSSDQALYGVENGGDETDTAGDEDTEGDESEAAAALLQTLGKFSRQARAKHVYGGFDDEDAEDEDMEDTDEDEDMEDFEGANDDDTDEDSDAEDEEDDDEGTSEVEDEDDESSDDDDDDDGSSSAEGTSLIQMKNTDEGEDEEAALAADASERHENEAVEEEVSSLEDEGAQDAEAVETAAGGLDDEAAVEQEEALQDESEGLEASEA